jgi:predicted oxidoreductase (fatty acid repression mutant protein)
MPSATSIAPVCALQDKAHEVATAVSEKTHEVAAAVSEKTHEIAAAVGEQTHKAALAASDKAKSVAGHILFIEENDNILSNEQEAFASLIDNTTEVNMLTLARLMFPSFDCFLPIVGAQPRPPTRKYW